MFETHSVENLESENEDLGSNNGESGDEDQPHENINIEPEANDGHVSEQSKLIKSKKVVRNPQPKLNADTLRGPKGLVALESVFKNVKFRGSGHEEDDLNHLMKTYEYWCNRLFPKYPFDECISKIEKLGSKKIVQTYVKKIRLGILDEDHIENDVVEENEETTEKDGWDEIFDSLSKESSMPNQLQHQEPVSQQFYTSNNEEEVVLSEEVKERIRKNQEQARKIREEKLKNSQLQSNNSNFKDVDTLNSREYQCYTENNVMNPDIMETDYVANELEKSAIFGESNINSVVIDTTADIDNSSALVSDIIQQNNSEGNRKENRKSAESDDDFTETVNIMPTC